MSNADGKQPDFDEFNLPGDEGQFENLEELDLPDASDPLAGLELPDASDPLAGIEGGDADGPGPVGASADDSEQVGSVEDAGQSTAGKKKRKAKSPVVKEKKAKKEKKKKEKPETPVGEPGEGFGTAGLAVFAACGISVLLLLVLDVMVFMKWGILLMLFMNAFWLLATAIPLMMWLGRKRLNFYEVMLGIALAAIIIAVALLLAELANYGGEATPKGGTASAAQLASESTIAVA